MSRRRVLAEFGEHRERYRVTGIAIDRNKPHLIHSCGADKTIVTFDLKQARRSQHFTQQEGGFCGLVQSTQGEQEIITADTAGCVKVWDGDVRQDAPIAMLVTWTERDELQGKVRTPSGLTTHNAKPAGPCCPPRPQEKKLNHIALDPSGNHLLLSTASGEIQVWELANCHMAIATVLCMCLQVGYRDLGLAFWYRAKVLVSSWEHLHRTHAPHMHLLAIACLSHRIFLVLFGCLISTLFV